MSFNTAGIIFLIAAIVWTISVLLPYGKLGLTKRQTLAIKIVTAAIFLAGFTTYAVTPPCSGG